MSYGVQAPDVRFATMEEQAHFMSTLAPAQRDQVMACIRSEVLAMHRACSYEIAALRNHVSESSARTAELQVYLQQMVDSLRKDQTENHKHTEAVDRRLTAVERNAMDVSSTLARAPEVDRRMDVAAVTNNVRRECENMIDAALDHVRRLLQNDSKELRDQLRRLEWDSSRESQSNSATLNTVETNCSVVLGRLEHMQRALDEISPVPPGARQTHTPDWPTRESVLNGRQNFPDGRPSWSMPPPRTDERPGHPAPQPRMEERPPWTPPHAWAEAPLEWELQRLRFDERAERTPPPFRGHDAAPAPPADHRRPQPAYPDLPGNGTSVSTCPFCTMALPDPEALQIHVATEHHEDLADAPVVQPAAGDQRINIVAIYNTTRATFSMARNCTLGELRSKVARATGVVRQELLLLLAGQPFSPADPDTLRLSERAGNVLNTCDTVNVIAQRRVTQSSNLGSS